MRKILLVFFTFHCSLLTTLAQTAVSTYLPGVTPEGAIYLLPKTGIRIAVQVEKTTYAPGELCKYAERYLRIKDVSPTPSVNYRITDIRQEAYKWNCQQVTVPWGITGSGEDVPLKPVLYKSMGSVWENGRVGVRRGPKAFAADCETGIPRE